MQTENEAPRAGWMVRDYVRACSFSKAAFYNIPDELKPRSIRLGRRRIIIEAPDAYLARLAASQKIAEAA